jgi:magnesium chelatase family protein
MSFATARTIALRGADGHLIDVQVDLSAGLVGTSLVGRPDAALNEARDRVKMAINNAAPRWPATKRVTILLAPADLPKSGTHFDLAIAVAVKAAAGAIPQEALDGTVFLGELSLSGSLRPVAGVLPMVLAASGRGIRRVFVPETQAREAAMVPGMTVFGMRSLGQVVAELCGLEVPDAPPIAEASPSRLLSWRGQDLRDEVDMSEVEGMEEARYAVEVAAAGGHHLMLSGPRGSGTTTPAERIPTVLPDLTTEQALELTALHSLAGMLDEVGGLLRRPPFFAPHHDASKASVLGGGTGRVRPGEVSLAHHGVLFLDEFPLFRSDVVDALRQPLEAGEVTIARGEEAATFPARGMVVLAANPCPCGNFHPAAGEDRCECEPPARRHYRRKLTGPVIDRIDIWRDLVPQQPHHAHDRFARLDDSATSRERVAAARARQAARFAGRGWSLNSAIPGPALTECWPLLDEARKRLDTELYGGRLTRSGVTRVHRLAWSVADLAGVPVPGLAEVEVALRGAGPLPLVALERAG